MRLIKADYIDKELKWYADNNCEHGVCFIPEFVVKNIVNLPTVDAKPVIYSNWDIVEDPNDLDEPVSYYCMSCHSFSSIPTHYCSNCGAKMDESGKETHAHWFDKGSLSCRCSACGCKNTVENSICPNCGTKMDEVISSEFN